VDRSPRGHRKPLRIDAKRAQGAAALSKAEFERFVTAARRHSPNALAIVLLLGLYGLRVSEVCDFQIAQLDWDHGPPVLRVAGKGRADNETSMFPLPHDIRQALLHTAAGRDCGSLLLKSTGRPYARQEIAALLRTLCGERRFRRGSRRTACARHSSPSRSTTGSPCVTFKTPRGTRIHGRPASMTATLVR
jgi:integrase